MPSKSSQHHPLAHEESGLTKVLHVLQLNGAHISVEAPAQPALEEKSIYFSISRPLFRRELVKEGQYTHRENNLCDTYY
jgi:hypothetical protein